MTRTGILLLHGLTGMPSELRPVKRYFEDLGFETEAPLLAGHGGTHHDLIRTLWTEWVASARKAMKNLLNRCDNVVVVGLSMGGTIGAILASEQPGKVSGLVMLSPTLSYDGSNLDNLLHQRIYKSKLLRDSMHMLVGLAPPLGGILYWTETPPYGLKDERLQAKITRSIEEAKKGSNTRFGLFRTYFASLFQMNLLTDKFRAIAGDVTCPVLILHSFEDTLASFGNATDTYNLLGSNDKRLLGLTGCDHVMTLDLERDQVCRLAGKFVSSISATPENNPSAAAGRGSPLKNKPRGLAVELCQQLAEDSQEFFGQFTRRNNQFIEAFLNQPRERILAHLVVRADMQVRLVAPLFLVNRKTILIGYPHERWHADLDLAQGEHTAVFLVGNILKHIKHSHRVRKVCLKDASGGYRDHHRVLPVVNKLDSRRKNHAQSH